MENPIKIAIAGRGYGKKAALPVYPELGEFEPVAVWSRRREQAREMAEEAGVELGATDFDELLPVPGLEAVHVAAPVATPVPFPVAAAKRGLHVMCELGVVTLVDTARSRSDAIEIYREGTVRLDGDRRVWWGRTGMELQSEGSLDESSTEAFRRVAHNFWAAVWKGAEPERSLQDRFGCRGSAMPFARPTSSVAGYNPGLSPPHDVHAGVSEGAPRIGLGDGP